MESLTILSLNHCGLIFPQDLGRGFIIPHLPWKNTVPTFEAILSSSGGSVTKSPTLLSVLAAWGLPPAGSKQLRGHAVPHPQLQPGPGCEGGMPGTADTSQMPGGCERAPDCRESRTGARSTVPWAAGGAPISLESLRLPPRAQ